MPKTITKTKAITKTAVGVALIAVAGVAVAAAVAMADFSPKLAVRINRTFASTEYVMGSEAEMLKVDLTASSGSVIVRGITFHAIADDDASFSTVENDVEVADHISSCSLVDSSGLTVAGPEAVFPSGELSFEGLIRVSRGRAKTYTVVCNFSLVSPMSENDDAYALMINTEADVEAEAAGGTALTGRNLDIGGSTDPGVNVNGRDVAITIGGSGTLAVSAASDMPTSTIILGNSTDVSVAKYKFTATDEDFLVNKITLFNCNGYNEDGECSDTGEEAGDDNVADVVTVSYTNSDGVTETRTGYLIDNYVIFLTLDLYVPVDEVRYLTVTVDTNSVGTTGATSGDIIQLNFDTETAEARFEAFGQSSGVTIDEEDAESPDSVAANEMTIYKTKPTLSASSSSPSGAAYSGANDVFHFNIAADSRGYVTLNEVAFKLSSTDIGATNWNTCDVTGGSTGIDEPDLNLYDMADLATPLDVDADWTMYDSADGSVCTEDIDDADYILLDLTTPDTIAAGTTVTYALYMTVNTTGANAANDDTLRISLETNATAAAGTAASSGTDGTINWEDDSASTDLYASLVRTLPINGNVLTF